MPMYLSQEWLDEATKLARDQPERPGATARMRAKGRKPAVGSIPGAPTVGPMK